MKQNKDFVRNGVNGYSSVNNASCTEAQQWRKYHSPNGHGFAAEDANAINDSLHGKKVDKIGINNELNGADRIVNGVPIQTKYCQSASKSVNNAFGANGYYRYPSQKLEVPKEQYEEAIRLMAEKIRNGKVPGVTDPAQAKEMVVKGSVTYKEAVNIAKAGNIDSIKFDMKTQAVSCGIACGISFLLVYANARYRGRNSQEALKEAMKVAVQSGVTTMAVGVATQQMLRTAMGRQVAAAATKVSKHAVDTVCRTQIGKAIVRKLMESMLGKQLTQVAARNAIIGVARTNVITGAAMTIATSVPDLIHLFMYSIFYTVIDGNGSSLSDNHPDGLPDLDSNLGENAPENWLEAYKSPYLKEIEHKETDKNKRVTKRYVVMNTGLFNDRNQELYLLFKENSSPGNQPWFLAGIYTYQENILVHYRNVLKYFLTDIDLVVFDKTKLSGWNNSSELACDRNHIKQSGRLEKILSDVKDDEKRMEEFFKSVTKSCIKTSFNYKFAVPYIYILMLLLFS